MATKPITDLTMDELDQAIIDTANEKDAIKVRAKELTAEYDRRCNEAAAFIAIAGMTDETKQQVINVLGIEPQSAVGTPGAVAENG
jgi:hypothetical protein